MDINRLCALLDATTVILKKGPVRGLEDLVGVVRDDRDRATENGGALVIESMVNEDEGLPPFTVKVDLHLATIAVLPDAESYRRELMIILSQYPRPDRLAGGPSYIEVGAELGDQGYALRLFALGHVLKLWKVIVPRSFGFEGKEADELAGLGYVMISGLRIVLIEE